MKTSSLLGMTYITWKERQTNRGLFEKTLSMHKCEKYHRAKNRVFQCMLRY